MSGEVKIYLSNYNPGALIDFGSLLGFWQFSPNKIGTIVIINKDYWLVRLYCMYIDLILAIKAIRIVNCYILVIIYLVHFIDSVTLHSRLNPGQPDVII